MVAMTLSDEDVRGDRCFDSDAVLARMYGATDGSGDVVWVLLGRGEEGRDWVEGVFRTRQEAMDTKPGEWVPDLFEPDSGARGCEIGIDVWEVRSYEFGKVVGE